MLKRQISLQSAVPLCLFLVVSSHTSSVNGYENGSLDEIISQLKTREDRVSDLELTITTESRPGKDQVAAKKADLDFRNLQMVALGMPINQPIIIRGHQIDPQKHLTADSTYISRGSAIIVDRLRSWKFTPLHDGLGVPKSEEIEWYCFDGDIWTVFNQRKKTEVPRVLLVREQPYKVASSVLPLLGLGGPLWALADDMFPPDPITPPERLSESIEDGLVEASSTSVQDSQMGQLIKLTLIYRRPEADQGELLRIDLCLSPEMRFAPVRMEMVGGVTAQVIAAMPQGMRQHYTADELREDAVFVRNIQSKRVLAEWSGYSDVGNALWFPNRFNVTEYVTNTVSKNGTPVIRDDNGDFSPNYDDLSFIEFEYYTRTTTISDLAVNRGISGPICDYVPTPGMILQDNISNEMFRFKAAESGVGDLVKESLGKFSPANSEVDTTSPPK